MTIELPNSLLINGDLYLTWRIVAMLAVLIILSLLSIGAWCVAKEPDPISVTSRVSAKILSGVLFVLAFYAVAVLFLYGPSPGVIP